MGVGQWRRGRVIGRGAFATVSLAASVSSGGVFAVKSSELSRSGPLQWEQKILSTLDSPFVVSYLGFGVAPPAPGSSPHYNLFMEYAAGGTLADAVKKEGGGLDEPAICAYARDILGGLAYLHSSGVVHCDLKPQNVLICSSGRAKIADLGCARLIADEEESGSGRRVQSRGTPMFMAPEVARAEEQGAAADVWALGCTVLEVATGRPPWPQVSEPAAALHRIAFSNDVPEIPSWISAEGRDFFVKCLRRDPRERWTAQQLLQHPFVADSKSDTSEDWISPKSTLDQAFWESISDEDDKVVEHETEDSLARMRSLLGGSGPNWTWDEKWVVVRHEDGEYSIPAIDSNEDRCHRSTNREAAASSSSASSSDNEFIVGADRADVEHVLGSACSHHCLLRECISVNDTTFIEAEGIQNKMICCKMKVNFANYKLYLDTIREWGEISSCNFISLILSSKMLTCLNKNSMYSLLDWNQQGISTTFL